MKTFFLLNLFFLVVIKNISDTSFIKYRLFNYCFDLLANNSKIKKKIYNETCWLALTIY